jgi:hypothetical protein
MDGAPKLGYLQNVMDKTRRPSERLTNHIDGIAQPAELDDGCFLPKMDFFLRAIFDWGFGSCIFFPW